MKRKVFTFVMVVMFMVSANMAFAQEKGTAAEAKALVKKAITFLKENGKEKTMAELDNPKGKFIYKDLYVYADTFDANSLVVLAHPYTPAMKGKNMINVKDADGKLFPKEIVNLAMTKGNGMVEFKWSNPKTKKIENKVTYLEVPQPGANYLLACGYYK
ncbi:MAG: cache domain-containing protein [Smithellaceae bacterium]